MVKKLPNSLPKYHKQKLNLIHTVRALTYFLDTENPAYLRIGRVGNGWDSGKNVFNCAHGISNLDWHHVAGSMKNNGVGVDAKIYVDGKLKCSGYLSGGNIAPGYSGILSFTFFNSGNSPIEIELGARIVHILFYEVKSGGNLYRGQWQGGRITAIKKEKQV